MSSLQQTLLQQQHHDDKIEFAFQVLLETNLDLRELNFDQFIKNVSNSTLHRYDLTMMVLSKMLKVVILFQHQDYLWISTPDVNFLEASVVLVYDSAQTIYDHYNTLCEINHAWKCITIFSVTCLSFTEYLQRHDRPLPFRNRYYFLMFLYPTLRAKGKGQRDSQTWTTKSGI